jgi:hypothetical protein
MDAVLVLVAVGEHELDQLPAGGGIVQRLDERPRGRFPDAAGARELEPERERPGNTRNNSASFPSTQARCRTSMSSSAARPRY